MSNAIVATLIFIAIIGGLALFLEFLGRLSFWRLAAKLPYQAIEFMSLSRSTVVRWNAKLVNL